MSTPSANTAPNLVPLEIAMKVASKIRKREPFAAYIVIPLFPEGDPTSQAVQQVAFYNLSFQCTCVLLMQSVCCACCVPYKSTCVSFYSCWYVSKLVLLWC